jgi:homeobox protein cut-like
MHGELEASLQAVSDSLDATRAELDKQLLLNEKLENDLLHINQHNVKRTGDHTPGSTSLNHGVPPSSNQDGLAGLDLGGKPTVNLYILALYANLLMADVVI